MQYCGFSMNFRAGGYRLVGTQGYTVTKGADLWVLQDLNVKGCEGLYVLEQVQ